MTYIVKQNKQEYKSSFIITVSNTNSMRMSEVLVISSYGGFVSNSKKVTNRLE